MCKTIQSTDISMFIIIIIITCIATRGSGRVARRGWMQGPRGWNQGRKGLVVGIIRTWVLPIVLHHLAELPRWVQCCLSNGCWRHGAHTCLPAGTHTWLRCRRSLSLT
jgi:hypothetical protein